MSEFSECSEWVETYDLYKGKSLDDDEPDSHRLSAKFKGNRKVLRPGGRGRGPLVLSGGG